MTAYFHTLLPTWSPEQWESFVVQVQGEIAEDTPTAIEPPCVRETS